MTREQLDELEPHKTMIYPKREGKSVQYMFMGINKDGKYQLCGMPFAYEDYLIMDCYEVVDIEDKCNHSIGDKCLHYDSQGELNCKGTDTEKAKCDCYN